MSREGMWHNSHISLDGDDEYVIRRSMIWFIIMSIIVQNVFENKTWPDLNHPPPDWFNAIRPAFACYLQLASRGTWRTPSAQLLYDMMIQTKIKNTITVGFLCKNQFPWYPKVALHHHSGDNKIFNLVVYVTTKQTKEYKTLKFNRPLFNLGSVLLFFVCFWPAQSILWWLLLNRQWHCRQKAAYQCMLISMRSMKINGLDTMATLIQHQVTHTYRTCTKLSVKLNRAPNVCVKRTTQLLPKKTTKKTAFYISNRGKRKSGIVDRSID